MNRNFEDSNSIISINPSFFRKYFYEISLTVLAGAIVSLFFIIIDLNNFIRTSLMSDKIEMFKVIDKNTEAINRNTNVLLNVNFKNNENNLAK